MNKPLAKPSPARAANLAAVSQALAALHATRRAPLSREHVAALLRVRDTMKALRATPV